MNLQCFVDANDAEEQPMSGAPFVNLPGRLAEPVALAAMTVTSWQCTAHCSQGFRL